MASLLPDARSSALRLSMNAVVDGGFVSSAATSGKVTHSYPTKRRMTTTRTRKRRRNTAARFYDDRAMTPVIVLPTVGADFDARSLARALIDQRLAACVNIVRSVTSVYRWQGRIEEEGEQL